MRKAKSRGAQSKSRAQSALPTIGTRLGARTEFRIYPSIGVARIGDCRDSFMIGPEAPGLVPSGPFRGADQGIKPQAARFRIYRVEVDANENEVVTEEIVAVHAHDRQVAVVAFQVCANEAHPNTRSIVETTENGWWYVAPINATRSMCMFVTDDDLLPRGAKRDLRAWWLDQLRQAVFVPRQFRDLAHSRDFVTRSARSQCLDVPVGSGWLAVGDAAMAFDPLASQGIVKALDHGWQAATSIAAYLKGEHSSLEKFALQQRREYAVFQATRAQYYRLEQRWPRSAFWRRRNDATKL